MKTSKIAAQFNVSRSELEAFIQRNELSHTCGMLGMELDDSYDLDDLIKVFKEDKADIEAAKAEERRLRAQFEKEKREALSQILITSGFNFDGYRVVKYSGYISGDDVVQIERGTSGMIFNATDVGEALSAALVKIRRNALQELKEAAYALGCNAIIGVDFDYITLDPETSNNAIVSEQRTVYLPYVFCVTANGNAVVIEKCE